MFTLSDQFKSLNREQRLAVRSDQNTLVIAGPGSGKTRIISVKAGLLAAEGLGVACLSFSNSAANQIRLALEKMHIYESSSLFVGTVHSFCLSNIIQPFISVVGYSEMPASFGIASTAQSDQLWERLGQGNLERGVNRSALRRAIIVDGEGSQISENVNILRAYDEELMKQNLVDFEMIVEHAVNILRRYTLVKEFLEYKFRWMLIDEYQDLGGGLHSIVSTLLDRSVKFLAVGDPNQLIYDFVGANERYIDDLKANNFKLIETVRCYRFGAQLIRKTQTILSIRRENLFYEPDDSVKEQGDIQFESIAGIANQARYIVETLLPKLQPLVNNDLSRIAILYRSRNRRSKDIVDWLDEFLNNNMVNVAAIEVHIENKYDLPESPFINWLCRCAAWSISTDDAVTLNEFPDLFQYYIEILRDSGHTISHSENLELETSIQKIIKRFDAHRMTVLDWMDGLNERLQLEKLMERSQIHGGDLFDLNLLRHHPVAQKSMAEIALDVGTNKVVLTTMHKSKGREFDYVILPAIDPNIMPRQDDLQDLEKMWACHRVFYVACSRAKKEVYIVHSPHSYFVDLLNSEIH